MTNYANFFRRLTGNEPFPYQARLGEGAWPQVLDIPTGLGKTAAVLVAWLYRRLSADPSTGRRLVYCLPMRVLVEQTRETAEQLCQRAARDFEEQGLAVPSVHGMLGGFVDEGWEEVPDRPAILVGTQDMLLSRALDRGYAMSRYKWPIHFGLLNSDCLWIFDETQLMGVGVETSAQLKHRERPRVPGLREPSPTTNIVGPVEALRCDRRRAGHHRRSPTTNIVGPVEAPRSPTARRRPKRSLRRRTSSAPLKPLLRV